MKSKTSFFNKTIFWNLLKRFWPIFAAYLGIWLIMLPVSLQNTLRYALEQSQYSDGTMDIALRAAKQVMNVSLYGGLVMSSIFAIAIAMAAYSYLYNARSVSMMCALPIKREGVFASVTAAGLSAVLVSNIIVILITMAVEAAFGALGVGYLLEGLAVMCLLDIFFFGFAALCASFTGHVLMLPAVYVVLNFTASAVELFVSLVLRVLLYGYEESYIGDFSVLSPIVGLARNAQINSITETLPDGDILCTGYAFGGLPLIIAYGVVGLIFMLCAMLLIKHRRMETASDVVAVKPLKPIFKYCMCVGCALVLGSAAYYGIFVGGWIFGISSGGGTVHGVESMSYMLLFMLLGGFVGYFGADMLMKKTLRVFKGRNWTGFVVSALIIAVLVVGAEFDLFGYERRVPELDDIDYVSIQCQSDPVMLDEELNIEQLRSLHESIVSHKLANEEFERGGQYYDYFNVSIAYTLKDGRYVSRSYGIYTDPDNELSEEMNADIYQLTDIMNTDEAVAYREKLDVPVSIDTMSYSNISYFDTAVNGFESIDLTPEQMLELYNTCIVPDIKNGGLGRLWYFQDESYFSSVYACSLNFELREREYNERGGYDNHYDYFDTTLTVDAARTRAWLKENLGIEPILQREADKLMARGMSKEEMEKYGYDMAVDYPAAAAVYEK